jgi:hypothetical protein
VLVDVDRFLAELRRHRGLKVARPAYEVAFRAACPDAGEHVDRRTYLREALDALATAGRLKLPASKSQWDRFGQPPLPEYIALASERTRSVAAEINWLPELAFAWDVKDAGRRRLLEQLNDFLIRHGEFEVLSPYNERSLQIFGDEKVIAGLLENGRLFGELPLDRIGAYVPDVPLVHARVLGAPVGRPGLVVENRHSYESFLRWNDSRRAYRLIVCGDGLAVIGQVAAIGELAYDLDVTTLEYVGDLDPMGVHVATMLADKFANIADSPPIVPAIPFYRYLLEYGRRRALDGSKRQVCSFGWLCDLESAVRDLFAARMWVPQESLGREALERQF